MDAQQTWEQLVAELETIDSNESSDLYELANEDPHDVESQWS